MNTISRRLAAGLVLAAMVSATGLARAQTIQPMATPTVAMPEKPPQYWIANGGTQGAWTALRQHCVAIFTEAARRQRLARKQLNGLPPIRDDWMTCADMNNAFAVDAAVRARAAAATPALTPSGMLTPTPMPPPPTSGWPAIGVAVLA